MSLPARSRIAVVGAGVSGLTAAHLLARDHHVSLYEADPRLGGHAHTHDVPVGGPGNQAATVAVDSGFIVHNDRTYPVLRRLFADLDIDVRPTEMSMSIHDEASGLAYAGGRGLSGFLGRPGQLLDREYLSMLRGVRRFHREATRFLEESAPDDLTSYGDFIAATGLPASFTRLYAVPLVACVWSTEVGRALDYPARHLFAFLRNHGMLSIGDSPQWFTVVGGSRTYVEALAERLRQRGSAILTSSPVAAISRSDSGVEIIDASGHRAHHDAVVVATHSDTALQLLADATPLEKELLGAIRYTANETVLHRDSRLLPPATHVRASWNYLLPQGQRDGHPIVTYWMNRLQGLPERHPLLVTLNATDRIDPDSVIATMSYAHPLFDGPAVEAQRRLPELASARTAFAGAYHGWGFHEDGARSGVAAAAAFGARW
jgi:predicted NAD/FAD-binding protein